MITSSALREEYDSSCFYGDIQSDTFSEKKISILSKEQIVLRIPDIFPASANSSKEQIFKEDLVTEGRTPVESGSSSIHFLKRNIKKPVAFNSLLKREGTVMSIMENYFTAKLVDLAYEAVDEIADFPFDEISDDDKSLLKEGAIFYWNIGYKLLPTGQKERSSIIRFRRLPAWTRKEIETAEKKADELASIFGW